MNSTAGVRSGWRISGLDDVMTTIGVSSRAVAATLVRKLWEQGLIEWASDTDGGVCWATSEEWFRTLADSLIDLHYS